MRKTLLLLLLGILFFAVPGVIGQELELGCCCRGEEAQTGSVQEITACDTDAGFGFVTLDAGDVLGIDPALICDLKCGVAPPVEFIEVELACGNLDYTPAAENIFIEPVRGDNRLRLTWQQNCTEDVNQYQIFRCAGSDCGGKDFTAIGVASQTNFEDTAALQWDTDYRYKITTSFTYSPTTPEAFAEGNTGDIECEDKFDDSDFCLALNSYSRYEGYLTTLGYRGILAINFPGAVSSLFGNNFNKGFSCNIANRLIEGISCGQDEICVATGGVAECRELTDCAKVDIGGYFGLNYDIAACEGSAADRYFCFYDRSHSLANNCYSCQIGMNCLDYRTQGTCERDSCGVSGCAWRPVYGGIGIGVCIDARFPSCDLCDFKGSPAMENLEAYNEIYDQCTKARSDALATVDNPCFYDPGTQTSKSCGNIDCTEYLQLQCGGPAEGITLDADNNIISGSTDPCGIGVCEWVGIGCFKNADGMINAGSIKDCAQYSGDDAVRCEGDYFPPSTVILAVGEAPGRTDYLEIYRSDKETFQDIADPVFGEDGYPTFFCIYVKDEESPCVPDTATTGDVLIVDNLFLQAIVDGSPIVVAVLQSGPNTIRYYSKDIHENLEVVKETDFVACDGCQGPKVLESELIEGRFVDEIWYTQDDLPDFEVLFNVPVIMTTFQYAKENAIFGTSYSQIANTRYTFSAVQTLSEGEFIFQLDAKNAQDVTMFPGVEIPFVYDRTPPSLIIYGNDEALFDNTTYDTQDITFRLEFDEKVVLEEAVYTANAPDGFFSEDFITEDLALSTNDNQTYVGTMEIPEGPVWLGIQARDYAGNEQEWAPSFHVHSGPPVIRLKEPSYGVSPTLAFDIIAETLNPATCRMWLSVDEPVVPPPPLFDFLEIFDATEGDVLHMKYDVTRITTMGVKYPLTIVCMDTLGRTTIEQYDLWVDDTPPEIISALAEPDPIIQYPYLTTLKVTTQAETFCKYSDDTTVPFDQMEKFPGYGRTGRDTHSQEVAVEDISSYIYYISCIALNELGPVSDTILFSVQEGAEFTVESLTERYFNTSEVELAVSTNKESLCYYSSGGIGIGQPMGDGSPGLSHTMTVTEIPGMHDYTITCATGGQTVIAGVFESASVDITFTIDTTPPVMDEVDDSSPLEETPDITYDTGRLRVKFIGHDDDTSITQYKYRILEKGTTTVAKDWRSSSEEDTWLNVDGTFNNGSVYEFEVYALNLVGLASTAMKSDGIRVDSGFFPDYCTNGVQDLSETDVDCGGECYPCSDGLSCSINVDCDSSFCDSGVCAAPSCFDGIKNGGESDVDCGGSCDACSGNLTSIVCSSDAVCYPGYCDTSVNRCVEAARCLTHDDCDTDFCDSAGYCVEPGQCQNEILDGDESDKDCGGSCPTKCADGQSCAQDTDCALDSTCVDSPSGKVCQGLLPGDLRQDTDGDGIPDWWEEKYCGGPTSCDAEADPDQDGLTTGEEYGYYVKEGWDIDPNKADSDGDGYSDSYEIDRGSDPSDPNSVPDDVDTDGDGIPDWYEEKYCGGDCDPDADDDGDGITNLDEFNYYKTNGWRLDPTNADTDGDGAEDGYEIAEGYDALNPYDFPEPSDWWWLLILLLFILIISVIAGYFFYHYREEKKLEEKPKVPEKKVPEKKEAPPFIEVEKEKVEKISTAREKLKGLFKVEKPQEFVSLEDIEKAEREKHRAKAMETKEVFGQLKRIREGKPVEKPKKPAAEAIGALRKGGPKVGAGVLAGVLLGRKRKLGAGASVGVGVGAKKKVAQKKKPKSMVMKKLEELKALKGPSGIMNKLQQVALVGLSKEEQKKILRQLQLLRLGQLSPEERAALLKKLKITANYYKKNKAQLQEELEQWLSQKLKVRKKGK